MEQRSSADPASLRGGASTGPPYNFASGPSVLPRSVLARAREALAPAASPSVLEVPFSSPTFGRVLAQAESDLRELLGVPGDYAVLFLQGGASAHFALLPLNLLGEREVADYVESGYWSRRASDEASRQGRVNRVASSAETGFDRVPDLARWKVTRGAAYLHITSNETDGGVQYPSTPEVRHAPLVADMSSDLLTRPIDVTAYGLIYASAQKNLGATGLAIVLARRDLLGRARPHTPAVFDYARQAEAGSRINTPPMFSIYLAGLMFQWIRHQGGLAEMERRAEARSARIYAAIDASEGFYRCAAQPAFRSRVNVCFHLREPRLVPRFLSEAEERGLLHLAGHAGTGGLRASMYNAMPLAGADALAAFMAEFMERAA